MVIEVSLFRLHLLSRLRLVITQQQSPGVWDPWSPCYGVMTLVCACSALQIFQKESHPSVYKSGKGSTKEGLSLFGESVTGWSRGWEKMTYMCYWFCVQVLLIGPDHLLEDGCSSWFLISTIWSFVIFFCVCVDCGSCGLSVTFALSRSAMQRLSTCVLPAMMRFPPHSMTASNTSRAFLLV